MGYRFKQIAAVLEAVAQAIFQLTQLVRPPKQPLQ
jgi:hypothetical protein